MGKGTGVGLIAAGAILAWVVEIDLPLIDDDALGVILMVAGVAALVAGLVATAPRTQSGGDRPETAAGTGIGLLLAGAILLWAVDTDVPYVDDKALAVILVVAGVVTVAASVVMNLQQSRTRNVVEYRAR